MHSLSIAELRDALVSKKFSTVELVEHMLCRIEKFSFLNSYITVCGDYAIECAKESDKRIQSGNFGELEGIPLAIKDLFLTKGIRTTAGSKILGNFIPPYESTVTKKLLDAGCVFLGKTNMDEFAMGSANITSHYGYVKNPWGGERDIVPGGSSGGSASAVAAQLCAGATGSDTGGSIRQPAAFVGIVGIKPTYGRCSRYGMIAFASSLDQAGPMGRTVRDTAILLRTMSGIDIHDSTSADVPVPKYENSVGKSIKGLRIGVAHQYKMDGMSQDIEKMWQCGIEWLKSAGAEIVDISLPLTKYALPVYYILAPAEASSNLARYDGVRYGFSANDASSIRELYEKTRAEGFGKEVKRRIMIGTYVLSSGYCGAYYSRALKIQKLIRQEFIDAFSDVDLILTPTTPNSAFEIGDEPKDPVTMYLNDIFTVTVNIAGLPAISVPVGFDSQHKPLGLQLIAPHFCEERLFSAGSVLEDSAKFPIWKENN